MNIRYSIDVNDNDLISGDKKNVQNKYYPLNEFDVIGNGIDNSLHLYNSYYMRKKTHKNISS